MPSSARKKSRQTSGATPSSRINPWKKRKFESSAVQFLYDRYVGDHRKRIEEYEREVLNAEIARKIYKLRTKAGLSQRELAKRLGTSASAVCRLEDADYEGHSLSMLKRVGEVLGRRVEIRFVQTKNFAGFSAAARRSS